MHVDTQHFSEETENNCCPQGPREQCGTQIEHCVLGTPDAFYVHAVCLFVFGLVCVDECETG